MEWSIPSKIEYKQGMQNSAEYQLIIRGQNSYQPVGIMVNDKDNYQT